MTSILTISTVGTVLFLFFASEWTYMLWRVLVGVSLAFSIVTTVKYFVTVYGRKNIAFFIGFSGLAIMLGGAIAQYPAQKILDIYGLYVVIQALIIMGILLIPIIVLLPKKAILNNIERTMGLKQLVSNTNALWISGYIALMNFPLIVIGAIWGKQYFIEHFHFSADNASLLTTCLFMGNMVGAPLLGWLSDRVFSTKKLIILASSIMFIFYIVLFAQLELGFSLYVILCLSIGALTGAQTLGYAMIAREFPSEHIGAGIGYIDFVSMSIGALMQYSFGAMMFTVSSTYLIYLTALLAIVCAIKIKLHSHFS